MAPVARGCIHRGKYGREEGKEGGRRKEKVKREWRVRREEGRKMGKNKREWRGRTDEEGKEQPHLPQCITW